VPSPLRVHLPEMELSRSEDIRAQTQLGTCPGIRVGLKTGQFKVPTLDESPETTSLAKKAISNSPPLKRISLSALAFLTPHLQVTEKFTKV
jgi:hypothetical protein